MSGSSSAVEIAGVVRDASGTPVPGAHVLFSDGPRPLPDIAAMTDAEGRFSLSAPTAGVYTLTCRADPLSGPPGTAEATVRVEPQTEGALPARMPVDLTLD
ncbi:carboxypeptidase-like regulatory domain-containing protein [Streptomyces sp. NPDC059900]|uniref:carboxypeptidase-like regulatory domain-containing protein n=1 Tax=Streptomyces sp. NPDC059900 TaxID=3155816 RepID=UPI00342FD34B